MAVRWLFTVPSLRNSSLGGLDALRLEDAVERFRDAQQPFLHHPGLLGHLSTSFLSRRGDRPRFLVHPIEERLHLVDRDPGLVPSFVPDAVSLRLGVGPD